MQWIQIAFFAMRMIIKYGPKVWKLGNQVYRDIEAKRHKDGREYSSDESAHDYNLKATRVLVGATGRAPDARDLNELRENAWKRNNMGRSPKGLDNATYRAMPARSGKARKRR